MLGFLTNLAGVLIMAVAAILVFFWMLRHLDERMGVQFKEMWNRIYEDPRALSVYLSARLVAVAVIIYAVFGKYV